MTTWTVVGGTGHRPHHLNNYPGACRWARDEATRLAVKVRDQHGCTTAISGFALGWDTWWAQAALDAGLALWAHIPFEAQPDRWTAGDRATWVRLRGRSAKETVYGPDPATNRQATALLFARNTGMVRASDAMTCLWLPEKRSGGTYATVRRIVKVGLPAIHVDPGRRTVWLGLPDLTNGGNA